MKYWGQTIVVPIGTINPRWQRLGTTAYYVLRYWGNSVLCARPRYGKSVLAKHIAVQIALRGRRVIIIDAFQEWMGSVTKKNPRSTSPCSMPNLLVLKDVTLKISDLKDPSEWLYLGFSGRSAEKLCQIAQATELHHNIPQIFGSILEELPCKKNEIQGWNEKYPKLFMSVNLFAQTYQSINNRWYEIENLFYNPREPKGKTWVRNWKAMAYKHNLLIDLNLSSEGEKSWGGAIVGHILLEIEDVLKMIKPLIISEEANFLFGDPDKTGQFTMSQDRGVMYVNKYAKRGVAMLFISQSAHDLHPEILKHITTYIEGDVPRYDPNYEFTSKWLRFNLDLGIRPFLMQDKIKGLMYVFDPCEPSCAY